MKKKFNFLLKLAFCLFFLKTHPSYGMTFNEAVQKYLEANPELIHQKVNISESKYKLKTAELFWTPTLGAEIGNQHREFDDGWSAFAGLNAKLNLFRFGGDADSLLGSQSLVAKNEHLLLVAQQKAQKQIAELLFQRIEAHFQVDFIERLLKTKEESVKIAQIRYKQGKLPQQDVDKLSIDKESTLIKLNNSREEELQLLQNLRHFSGSDLTEFIWPWKSALDQELIIQESTEPAQISALKEDLLFQEYTTKYLKSAILPTLDLRASWSNAELGPGSTSANLTENGSWTLAVSINLPLWNRLSDLYQYKVQIEREASLQKELAFENLQVKESRDHFKKRFQLKKANVLLSASTVNKSKSFYQDSLKSFQLGRSSVNDLFIEQNRLLDSESSEQAALKNYHITLIEYCHLNNKSILNCFN